MDDEKLLSAAVTLLNPHSVDGLLKFKKDKRRQQIHNFMMAQLKAKFIQIVIVFLKADRPNSKLSDASHKYLKNRTEEIDLTHYTIAWSEVEQSVKEIIKIESRKLAKKADGGPTLGTPEW